MDIDSQQTVVQVLPVGTDLPAEQFAHLPRGVVVVIERGDRLAEAEVLGAEDGAARDGDAVVDYHARVVRYVGQRLGDGAAIQVVEHQAALQADQQDAGFAGFAGFGEESRTSRQRVVNVLPAGQVKYVDAAQRPVRRILDANPHERIANYARTFGQVTLLFQGGAKIGNGFHSARHRFL